MTTKISATSLRLGTLFVVGPAREIGASCNQPRAALVGHIRPEPLDHHNEPVAEADQEKDVYEQPAQPCKITRDVQAPELCDCRRPADGSQAPFVHIVEIFSRLVP